MRGLILLFIVSFLMGVTFIAGCNEEMDDFKADAPAPDLNVVPLEKLFNSLPMDCYLHVVGNDSILIYTYGGRSVSAVKISENAEQY